MDMRKGDGMEKISGKWLEINRLQGALRAPVGENDSHFHTSVMWTDFRQDVKNYILVKHEREKNEIPNVL